MTNRDDLQQINLTGRRVASAMVVAGVSVVLAGVLLAGQASPARGGSESAPDDSADAATQPQTTTQAAATQPAPDAVQHAGQADHKRDKQPPQRVIVHVNRFTTIKGHIEFEDDNAVVVRDLSGKVHSLVKSRVQQLVRLIDAGKGVQGRVFLNNGQVRKGLILADEFDRVVMKIKGIRTELPREAVAYVEPAPSFQQRYENFKAGIQPGQHHLHLQLARWLIDQRRYELAKKELETLLRNTEMKEAQRLLRMVNAQIRLMQSASPPAEPSDADTQADASAAESNAQRSGPTRWLTREEVNLIRVYEIDFRKPSKMRIAPETIQKLIDEHATDPRIPASRDGRKQLLRAEPEQVAQLMFRVRARNLYNEIEVLSEPQALDMFRRKVHDAWLVNNCSTRHCHGGPDAGEFQLHRRRARDSRVAFANLLILERLKLNEKWPLVNYEKPEMSLIIQHGLPQQYARLPHPDVPGWEPVFRTPNSRALRHTLQWVKMMMRPRPNYPIEFDPNRPAGADEWSEIESEAPARAPR